MHERYAELATAAQQPILFSLLDNGIDMAGLHYYTTIHRPFALRPQDGVPLVDHAQEEKVAMARCELALYSHARAQAEADDSYDELASLSWARFAQRGLRRMAHQLDIPAMRDYANSRPFTNVADQVETYDEMAERLVVLEGPPIETSDSLEYAIRVAQREIVLKTVQF